MPQGHFNFGCGGKILFVLFVIARLWQDFFYMPFITAKLRQDSFAR